MPDQPLTLLQRAIMEAVRPTARGRLDPPLPGVGPLAEHGCLHAAVIVFKGRRTWFPCRSHKGGVHRFLARLDACSAPWCRLPAGHRELHDIPSGTVEIHDAIGTVDRG